MKTPETSPARPSVRLVLASASPARRRLLSEAGYEFEVIEPPGAESPAVADPRDLAERLAYLKARQVAQRLHSEKDDGSLLGIVQNPLTATGVGRKTGSGTLASRSPPPSSVLVLGADTVVVLGDQVIGKPADADDARRILRTLAGTRHQVITGVCVIDVATGLRLVGSEVTRIKMRSMSDGEIETYVNSGAGLGKAGAYAVQEHRDAFVEELDGSYTNVVGLPMELVGRMLRLAAGFSND